MTVYETLSLMINFATLVFVMTHRK
ncbi:MULTISPECIES: putative holin-like toxin [Paenibacillus]